MGIIRKSFLKMFQIYFRSADIADNITVCRESVVLHVLRDM